MAVYKASNSGLLTRREYTSFLAGNDQFIPWAPSGAYDSIATASGTGSSGIITFSSIPATYTHLQIRAIFRNNRASSGLDVIYYRLNGDSGTNYPYHTLYGDGASAGALSATAASYGYFCRTSSVRGSSTANAYGVAVFDLLDYTNTNKNKTTRTLAGGDLNGSGAVELTSSMWMSTSAVTSIELTAEASANFTTDTRFALYGIKGA